MHKKRYVKQKSSIPEYNFFHFISVYKLKKQGKGTLSLLVKGIIVVSF